MKNDVIFRAYLTNLGAYNEGELIGKWIDFPIQNDSLTLDESVKKILAEIGVDGKQYEEYFITDYDSEIDGLVGCFGEYENIFLLNYLANKILEMDCNIEQFEAILELGESTGSVMDLINLVCNTESFYFLPEVENDYDLGYEYAVNSGMFTTELQSIGTLANYIDYESYGRDIRLTDGGIHTANGYITMTDKITIYFDDAEDIPDLYN